MKSPVSTSPETKGALNAANVGRARSNNILDSSDRSPTKKRNRLTSESERSLAQEVLMMSSSQAEQPEAAAPSNVFASKSNSAFKWQRARGVIGALEVNSEPYLRVRDELDPHLVEGKEDIFHAAVQAWEDLKLGKDFIKAVENLPGETCCCGFMSDAEASKRNYVSLLNEGWCKQASKRLNKAGHAIKVDTFIWNWQNASGKAETNIILIRFFELSTNRFRKASDDGSNDVEFLEMEQAQEGGALEEPQVPDKNTMVR